MKKRLGIIFGGKSDEHEISILSASSIIDAVDRLKYEVIQIGISKAGGWYLITDDMSDISSLSDERIKTLIPSGSERDDAKKLKLGEFADLMDFAFPVLHGPFGEDGTIQGLFEMLELPYAGCGVTSSALSMDKIFTKEMWIRAGLPVCRHKAVNAYDIENNRDAVLKDVETLLGYPLFIKPANMGSSVGITKAWNMEELINGAYEALNYDSRIIIEEEIKGREFETGVLGNNTVQAAEVGEIVTAGKFYDYESKYRDGSTRLYIPADIPDSTVEEVRLLAVKAFKTLDGSGFSRVDFFMEEETGKIYLNEMNTIPGFTRFSMFPLLWKESGLEYGQLIERIIELGYERYYTKNNR